MGARFTRVGQCRRFCGNRCCSIHGYKGTPEYDHILKEFKRAPFGGLKHNGECVHLKMEKGLPVCAIYDTRPEICQRFPEHPRDIAMMPECEYHFIPTPRPVVKRPEPIHPKLLLQWFEVWPLFDVQKTILDVPIVKNGHVVRKEERTYVMIQELPDLSKRPDGIQALIGEVRRLEWKCWNQGVAGWIAGTSPDNLAMQGAIVGYGARLYQKTDTAYWFVYEVNQRPPMTGPGLDDYSPLPTIHDIQIGAQAYVRSQAHLSV